MEPLAGGPLAHLVETMADPLLEIVARLAKGPTSILDAPIALADLVECDFAGYAPIPLTATLNEAVDDPYYAEADSQSLQWVVGAISAVQPIVGLYYTSRYNGGAWGLVTAVPFDEPMQAYYQGQLIAFEASLVNIKTA